MVLVVANKGCSRFVCVWRIILPGLTAVVVVAIAELVFDGPRTMDFSDVSILFTSAEVNFVWEERTKVNIPLAFELVLFAPFSSADSASNYTSSGGSGMVHTILCVFRSNLILHSLLVPCPVTPIYMRLLLCPCEASRRTTLQQERWLPKQQTSAISRHDIDSRGRIAKWSADFTGEYIRRRSS